jgi:hypothetical protein
MYKKTELLSYFNIIPSITDGNCMYEAIGNALDVDWRYIKRDVVQEHCKKRKEEIDPDYLTALLVSVNNNHIIHNMKTYDDYIRHIASDNVWGGEPELQIIAHIYNVQIDVFKPCSVDCLFKTVIKGVKVKKIIPLYHNNNHYEFLSVRI